MEKRFEEMSKQNISMYQKRFLSLPPQSSQHARIKNAIENEVPLEYLIFQKIITLENIEDINLGNKEYNFAKEYMKHIGMTDSVGKFRDEDKKETKKSTVTKDKQEEVSSELELNKLKEEIKKLELDVQEKEEKYLNLIQSIKIKDSKRAERDLSSDVIQLEKKLEEANAQIDELVSKGSESDRGSSELAKNLREELQRVTIEYDKLVVDHDELKYEMENIFELEEDKASEDKNNVSETRELKNTIKKLNKEIEEYTKKIDGLTDKMNEKNEKEKDLKEEIQRLIIKYDTANNAMIDMEEKYALDSEKLTLLGIKVDRNEKEKERYMHKVEEASKIKEDCENKMIAMQEILGEKDEIIEIKGEEISKLKESLEEMAKDNSNKLKDLADLNEKKLEAYRKELSGSGRNELVDVVIPVKETTGGSGEVRARLEGKKVISIDGMGSNIVKEETEKIYSDSKDVYITSSYDDADIYILTTNNTKRSVEQFKEKIKGKNNVIKIMVDWDERIPFTPQSMTGSKMEIIIEYDKDWYKKTWVEDNPTPKWVEDLEKRISEVL